MTPDPARAVSWPALAGHMVDMVRGPALAALFTIYVFNDGGAFPRFLEWARTDGTWPTALADWVADTLPTADRDPLDVVLLVLGVSAVHFTMYVGVCLPLAACDTMGWWQQHKLPRKPAMQPSRKLISWTLKEAAFSQFVILPVVMFVLVVYVAHFRSFYTESGTALPPQDFLTTMLHFMGAQTTNEFLFYIAHRSFHEVPVLYQRFHKQHHMYVGTIGIAAEFAHPVEQAFANQIPTAAYCLLMAHRIHPTIFLVWIGWRLFETYESHSGYCFEKTWLSQLGLLHSHRARWHDFHHTVNRGNYGTFILDYLFGSMDAYVEHQRREHHDDDGDAVGPTDERDVLSWREAAKGPAQLRRPRVTSPPPRAVRRS